jgi:truncated hemoglobin YjbI
VNAHSADAEPTLFQWAGGAPAVLRTTQIFYGKYVPNDSLLSTVFAKMPPDHPERVAAWIGEVFGGPKAYSSEYGDYNRMIAEHLDRRLTEAQRSRWVALMSQSADDAGLPTDPEFRAAFAAYLEWGSRITVENSQPGAAPPPNMPIPKWWWVCNAVPHARRSALAAPEAEVHVTLPAPGEAVSFERHIRGLFRTMDRQSMMVVFDLWAHDDVKNHASAIASRLADGTMPCDGGWSAERVAIFQRWVDEGCAP